MSIWRNWRCDKCGALLRAKDGKIICRGCGTRDKKTEKEMYAKIEEIKKDIKKYKTIIGDWSIAE